MVRSLGMPIDLHDEKAIETLSSFAFERYTQTASLIGAPEQCLRMVQRLHEIGVDEVACLIDFGLPNDLVLHGLAALDKVRQEHQKSTSFCQPPFHAPDPQFLRQFLKQSLPESMLPDEIILLDELPLLPNGKIDRQALAAMYGVGGEEIPIAAPRTPIEQELAAIWCELLKVDHVSLHDNFFELGGHSLLAMQLTARLYNLFGIDLNAQEIFSASTLEKMTQRLEEAMLTQTDKEELNKLLALLDSMDDDEVQAMLSLGDN
jgi:acyl carrier protein